jgi:hypothetical protein|mmetsp:Transcript_28696/g.44866  ORF Transcript_28696/g.44866 Transcript_28696/m.44866 type:complete len:479 (-) Transcript_28696:127-1563(-)|eukprot:CAMPEP_0169158678 /NCGR_PEP_ID=MMETSP1015-20121227/55338_1 /TAXON_ID=342587 /ORGANISM="Karlodinium micrum, Strain CCMP2283" /LENGTH=478 /DNA_ID=CAMNT_0009229881 /DNA_START=195 /DNA_END=1631 /DNA_ORIENTATION=+
MTEVLTEAKSSTVACDMQEQVSESAPSLSGVSGSSSKRDMKAELEAWKEERAARLAQQRAEKSRHQQAFKVPQRTAPSPSRTPSLLNENVPSIATAKTPCKTQNKTPCKTPGNLARQALGERSPNTCPVDSGNVARSVSPLARQLYKPAPRVRQKTPEPVKLTSRLQTSQPAQENACTTAPPQRHVSPHRAGPPQKPAVPPPIKSEDAMELMDYLPALPVESAKTQAENAETKDEAETQDGKEASEEAVSPTLEMDHACPTALSPPPPAVCQDEPPVPIGSPPELPLEDCATTEDTDSPVMNAEEKLVETCVDSEKCDVAEESHSLATDVVEEKPLAIFMDNRQVDACNHTCATSPSPAPRTSLGSVSPKSSGLISAYEERVGLPRQPPPSPATPSPALTMALSAAKTLHAADFARAAGAALVRIAAEEPIDECKATAEICHLQNEKLLETPCRDSLVESPAPLSPLSLGSSGEDQES